MKRYPWGFLSLQQKFTQQFTMHFITLNNPIKTKCQSIIAIKFMNFKIYSVQQKRLNLINNKEKTISFK